jgi:TldD protein
MPRHELADAALTVATAAGASYAALRIHRISTEIVQLRDGELETSVLSREIGLAVRLVVDGTWGFASHAELTPDVAADTARRAVQVARTLGQLNADRMELADEPVYADAEWVSSYAVDPFDVPTADKIAVLVEYSRRLLAADGVDHVSAGVTAVKEQTFYADAHPGAADSPRLGGGRRRPGVGLVRRTVADPVVAGGEDQGARRRARPD